MVYCPQAVTHPSRNHLIVTWLGVKPTASWSCVWHPAITLPSQSDGNASNIPRPGWSEGDWREHDVHSETHPHRAPVWVVPTRSSVCRPCHCELHRPWHPDIDNSLLFTRLIAVTNKPRHSVSFFQLYRCLRSREKAIVNFQTIVVISVGKCLTEFNQKFNNYKFINS